MKENKETEIWFSFLILTTCYLLTWWQYPLDMGIVKGLQNDHNTLKDRVNKLEKQVNQY